MIYVEMERKTMMVSTPEEVAEAGKIVVYDGLGPLSIVGRRIANVSWTYEHARRQGHDRWTDLALYRVENDPNMKYAVQITGRSSLYHREDGPCSQGVSMPISELLKDDARYKHVQPCKRHGCEPDDLDFLSAEDSVQVEMELYRLYRCRDADEVVRTMYNHGKRDNRRPTEPSGLSVKLLTTASVVDEAIKMAIMNMPR